MLIRYPGSKDKLYGTIRRHLPDNLLFPLWQPSLACYCEPFFGSGAIGWRVLKYLSNASAAVILNDVDPGLARLWNAVRSDPHALIDQIRRFRPSVEAFEQFKREDGDDAIVRATDPVVIGFRKLALHQMSFSGLGAMAGGPLGGKVQDNPKYPVNCRWRPERLEKYVRDCYAIAEQFPNLRVFELDFAAALRMVPDGGFVYLDPPYYVQGAALYKHSFAEADHERLAEALRDARYTWLLSYDDHPRVRELYWWAKVDSFSMTPTVQTSRAPSRRKNQELLITNVQG